MEEAHDRAAGFLEVFHTQVERKFPGQHKRVLLVSHAAPVIALTRELVGDRNLPLRIGCCSLTELRRKEGHKGVLGAYEYTKLASGEHLEQGASRDWGFEDCVLNDGKVGGVWSGEPVFDTVITNYLLTGGRGLRRTRNRRRRRLAHRFTTFTSIRYRTKRKDVIYHSSLSLDDIEFLFSQKVYKCLCTNKEDNSSAAYRK